MAVEPSLVFFMLIVPAVALILGRRTRQASELRVYTFCLAAMFTIAVCHAAMRVLVDRVDNPWPLPPDPEPIWLRGVLTLPSLFALIFIAVRWRRLPPRQPRSR